jgi:hypothetical protein
MPLSIPKRVVLYCVAAGVASGAAMSVSSLAEAAGDNGITSMPANKIATTALNAMQSVQSLTISGVVHQGHQTIALNVSASASGQGQGTIAINGQPVNIASTGSTAYMKAGAAFWRKSGVPANAANRLSGQWISLSSDQPGASSLTSALNSKQFLSQLPKNTDKGTTFQKVGTGTLNGQPAIKIRATNPSKTQDNAVIYVATTGSPYVLRIAGSNRSSFGTVNFTDYDRAISVQPPAGAISLSQIEQQG